MCLQYTNEKYFHLNEFGGVFKNIVNMIGTFSKKIAKRWGGGNRKGGDERSEKDENVKGCWD